MSAKMDERRRHGEPSRNQPGMGYGVPLQQEDMSYMDQLLQDDRSEQFVNRNTNQRSMYGHHSGASYYGTPGNHGSSYPNWQSQTGNLSNPPNMYSSQTYPNYPSYDHSRFATGQLTGDLAYPGYRRYDNIVHRTHLPASQSLPSTVDSRHSSWNDDSYRNYPSSGQASAQRYSSYSTTYGANGRKMDVSVSQIPQSTLSNNYSASSEVCVNDRSFNDAYDRRGVSMNYQASRVSQGLDYHSDNNEPNVSMPPPSKQKHSSESCQTNLPLRESTGNSMDGNVSVPTVSQRVENVSDDGCKQDDHHEIASCITGEKTERPHSSHLVDEKASSTQNDIKTSGANYDHLKSGVDHNGHKVIHLGQGGDRKGTLSASQMSLDQGHPASIPEAEHGERNMSAALEPVKDRTKQFEKVSAACKRDQNTKVEATMDTVKSLPTLKNTSSDLPVSVTPYSQNTSVAMTDETIRQEVHKVDGASHQNLPKEKCDDNVNVKEVSAPKNTQTTFRTTVDLSAVELGCSTVVKFEDGTCKYIKEEPRSEHDEESFYCTSQQPGGKVGKQKIGPSEENNPLGAQGVKDHLLTIKQEKENAEPKQQQGSDSIKESLNEIIKLEVDDGSGGKNPRELVAVASDASLHNAIPMEASDLYPDEDHIDSNYMYDSDGWQVGSDKQDQDSSSKCSTRNSSNDEGMLDRCPTCNELVACTGMKEHSLTCKAEPNLHESPPIHPQSPNDEATLKCPECGVGFQTTDDLVIHLRIHEMLAKSALKMKADNRMMLMTEEMGKRMTDKEGTAEEQSEECGVCYESFTDPTMVPYHNMMHQQFPFHCKKCNLFFSSLTELRKSRCSDQKHHKVFKYRCGKCKGALMDSYKMRKHRKRCEGKMETCRLCQNKFSSFKQLALHAEICNEEWRKKEMEKAGECGKLGDIEEETVSDIECRDHKAVHVDYTTLEQHQDIKAADPRVSNQDAGLEIQSEDSPTMAEIKESVCQETDCADSIDKDISPRTVIDMSEYSQLSEEKSNGARCKMCEKELPISLRYHGRACKETPEYCKDCLNLVKSTNVTTHDENSASQKSLYHKRPLPTESISSIEETCENAIVEPSKKKHKKARRNGETCGACGRWFKNFKKLEKHAAHCDGVVKKCDRGACPEPISNDDINLEWKGPTVSRCPKCEKKFVKEKKLKKHVKSCGWIQERIPSTSLSTVVHDPSDLEDELSLSAIRNVNGAVVEDSDVENVCDTVGPSCDTVPTKTTETSNEFSRVEPPFKSSTGLEEVDKGESDQSIIDMPDNSAQEAEKCVSNETNPSFQNGRSISEVRIEQYDATSKKIGNGYASGASEKRDTKESSVVDAHADSTEQPIGMETPQISNSDEQKEISNNTLKSSAHQATLASSSQHFIEVPAQDKSSQNIIAHETIPQEQLHVHVTQRDKSELHRKNMTSLTGSDTCPQKDLHILSFTQANQKAEINTVDSANSAPQEIRNEMSPSSLLASPPSTGVEMKEKESESSHPENNLGEQTDLGRQLEGKCFEKVGEDIESCYIDVVGVPNAAVPDPICRVIDKVSSQPVIHDATSQLPGQSRADEGTRGHLPGDDVVQAKSPTHAASFQESTIDKTKVSFELMQNIEGGTTFSELREESSLDSSVEVEYAMSLGAVKGTSIEGVVAPSHHCVYCAAEFSSRDDLWQHARGCRDNHLMVIASHVAGEKEYQLVEKPVTWGNSVPWQVLNDYSKKEAIVMRNEIGIDLSCVIPSVGYKPPSKKPKNNKKRKKKKKIKDKEEIEKEKQKEIERKKRRKRERKREKLFVQAKLQQLEQNPGKKFRFRENQKTYACELCNQRFHSRGRFEKHKLNHVSNTGKKTLAVCVEKLDVKEIDNHTKFESTRQHSGTGNIKLKEKKSSKEKHSKVTESKSITKKKKSVNRPATGEEENEDVDVENLDINDRSTKEAQNIKRFTKEAPQSNLKLSEPIQTFEPLGTPSGNVDGSEQGDMLGRSHVKSKGIMLKKNEFGVQFPVVIEVECPDCGMKFNHQSTLERHRRLHKK